MYRRLLSIVLSPCVLLAPSAAFGHSHGGDQAAGHDLRPHLHTNPIPASPTPIRSHHHHGPGGHHHDAAEVPTPETPPTHDPLSDHDSDAVFLAGVDAAVGPRVVADELSSSSVIWAAVGDGSFAWRHSDLLRSSPNRTHPPPRLPACPLYVRHLTLLI